MTWDVLVYNSQQRWRSGPVGPTCTATGNHMLHRRAGIDSTAASIRRIIPPLFAGHKCRTVQSVATMPTVLGLKSPIWMLRVKPPMSDHGNHAWSIFLIVSKQAFIVTIWYSWSLPHSFWHNDAALITSKQLWNRYEFWAIASTRI